ncbi:MAG: dockerin type I domain-containing protein [Planctomycetota bacterium]|nr:dockerin type I domain-containing protein [Planctomycetota bacterium]
MPTGLYALDAGMTLTLGSGITIGGVSGYVGYSNAFIYANRGSTAASLVNQGTIRAEVSGKVITVQGQSVSNHGTLAATGGMLVLNGPLTNTGSARLASTADGEIMLSGQLLGNTQNADLYSPQGTFLLNGAGTATTPQVFEVMSQDRGPVTAGFNRNFAYGTLTLSNSTYVRLLDESDNAAGIGPEAIYVNSLMVESGATLDLNGLNLYARGAQVNGTIVGGSIIQVSDGGSISLGASTLGTISAGGEADEWALFGRAGRSVTLVANPGSRGAPAPVQPYLGYAELRLLDPSGNVLATAYGADYQQIVTLDSVVLPADGNYRVQVRASAEHASATGNYVLTAWDVTPDIAPLTLNQERVGHVETPYSVDRWTFSAAAGQQVRFDLINESGSVIVFDLTGPAGWTGFSSLSTDSETLTLPSSGSYTLTAHGTGGQYGGVYAFQLVESAYTDLTLGTAYNGTFVGSGQAQLFRVHVPASVPMTLTLDDSAAKNQNELYVKYGAPPTRADYDYGSTASAAADQQVLVPMATPGTWYVLVRGDYVPNSSRYALVAIAAEVLLTAVTPEHHGNGSAMTLTLTGSGFDNGTVVTLVGADNTTYTANLVAFDSFTQMTATFAAGAVPVGRYSVRVARSDGRSADLPEAFQVIDQGQPKLVTNLIVPNVLGLAATGDLYVEYTNTGDVAMPAPLLVLHGSNRALMKLVSPQQPSVRMLVLVPAPPSRASGYSDTVQFTASGKIRGLLQPGESGRVRVLFGGLEQPWDLSNNSIGFELGVLGTDNTIPVDWSGLKDSMRPVYISAAAWDPIWANFVAQVGSTWADYQRMLDDNEAYLGRLGTQVPDVSELLAFEFQQADGLGPVRTLASAVDATVEEPGLPIVFSRVFSEPISRRYELGTLGYGWSDNWDYQLSTASDGTVTVHGPAGSQRVFQPDSRHPGSYIAQPGDHGTLTATGGGAFNVREADGLLYAFQADGQLDYVQDTNGYKIDLGYTSQLLTSLAHHAPGQALADNTVQIAYNSAGRIATITDPDNRQTVFHYDAANQHLTSVDYFDGRTVAYAYATDTLDKPRLHALKEITYPGEKVSTFTHQYFTYDTQGRPAAIYRDDNAERVEFAYDSAGKVTVTNAAGDVGQFYFDQRGLLVKTVDGLGNAVSMAYDTAYNLTAVTDPSGHASTYGYDANGNVVRSTDANGGVTRFTYTDTYNRLASVIDANGNPTRYAYDSHGNLSSITYADGSRESWAYNDPDNLSDPSVWTNRRGNATPGDPNDHVVAYDYDTDGHLLSKTYADGSRVDYTYDTRGNLQTATDATGTTTFTYDPATEQLTRIDYPGRLWLAFTYNSAGQRASSLDQLGHQLTYHYDAVGRLDDIENESGVREVDYAYDAAGRLVLKTLGNGVFTTYDYDHAGQLLHLINYKPDASVLSRFDYTYDSRGQRVSMNTLDGAWSYTYDDIGQLTHAVFVPAEGSMIPAQDETYVYDPLGNRIRTIINGVTTEYTTNNMNQYVTVGGVTYAYDRDGNLIQQGGTTYTYNDENRLTAVNDGTNLWQYTYDALGNRVATTENGTTTHYVIDPIGLGNVVGEYDASGNLVANNHYGFGLTSQIRADSSVAYYTFDAIGNAAELTTDSLVIVNSYAYAPFGTLLHHEESISNLFQFVGQHGVMADSHGHDSMRAREFDTILGRFLTADPFRTEGGLNQYAYCWNEPNSIIDPLGLRGRWQPDTSPPPSLSSSSSSSLAQGIGEGFEVLLWLQEEILQNNYWSLDSQDGKWKPPAAPPRDVSVTWDDYEKGVIVAPDMRVIPQPKRTIYVSWEEFQYGSLHAPGIRVVPMLPNPPTGSVDSRVILIPNSHDPNEKTGPAGFGTASFISDNGALAYRVDFENESSATAPAQVVSVTDQLDSDLDWTTFRLTEIAFGDQVFSVEGNSQQFEKTVPMTYNGVDFEVQIEAGIRSDSGQVYANFYSIDPNSGLPPSVLVGLLPPEDGTGRGLGHISYTVDAAPGLPTGTQIRNVALIQFDYTEIIATNQVDPHDPAKGTDPAMECLNTIDAVAPSSSVQSLPATTATAQFIVQWSGQDDAGGSGIRAYDVFVTTDAGPPWKWQDATTQTSATFTGEFGHTYAFSSVATDNVGHVEAATTTPDAETTVSLVATAPTVTLDPAAGQATWTGSLPIHFAVVFSQAVNGFVADDVTVIGSAPGTAVVEVTGGPATYDVAIGGLRGNGTVIVSLAAEVAQDAAGYGNLPSTSGAHVVTYLPYPAQNTTKPCDVTGDGRVEPIDVLTLIIYINAHPVAASLPTPPDLSHLAAPFLDVNGDNYVTPADVLTVINYINNPSARSGEGEPSGAEPTITVGRLLPAPLAESWATSPERRWDSSRSKAAAAASDTPVFAELLGASRQSRLAGVQLVLADRRNQQELDACFPDLDGVLPDIIQDVACAWRSRP